MQSLFVEVSAVSQHQMASPVLEPTFHHFFGSFLARARSLVKSLPHSWFAHFDTASGCSSLYLSVKYVLASILMNLLLSVIVCVTSSQQEHFPGFLGSLGFCALNDATLVFSLVFGFFAGDTCVPVLFGQHLSEWFHTSFLSST